MEAPKTHACFVRAAAAAVALAVLSAAATPVVRAQDGPEPPSSQAAAALDHPVFDSPVDAEAPPAALVEVNRKLREAGVIRAGFVEEKRIAVLRRPLRSEGTLLFSAPRGLYRRTTQPFEQELLVTPDGITQRSEGGGSARIDLSTQPAAKAFVEAFLLVASGDLEALASRFDLSFEGDAAGWSLGLVPRAEPLGRLISGMRLSGHDEVLEALVVVEAQGDVTTMTFHDVVMGVPLTPEEERTCFDDAR